MTFSNTIASLRDAQAAKTPSMTGFVRCDSAEDVLVVENGTVEGYQFTGCAAPTSSEPGTRYRIRKDYFTFQERANKLPSAYSDSKGSDASTASDATSYCYLRLTVTSETYSLQGYTVSSEPFAVEWRSVSGVSTTTASAPTMILDPQLLANLASSDWTVVSASVADGLLVNSGNNRW